MFTLSQNKLAIDGDNLAEDDAVAVSAPPETVLPRSGQPKLTKSSSWS